MAKRRANGEGSIRKRKDGRWEGRCTVGYDADGKRIIKNVLGKTQAECKSKLNELIQASQELDMVRSDDLTVADWVTQWYDLYAKPNIRPSTQEFYWNHIRFHIIPQIGKIKLRKLTSRDVQKLYNHVKTQGRVNAKNGKTELSNSYVRGLHMMLHNCMERAVKERLIPRNPTEDCIIPKNEKKEMKTLRPENIHDYLKAAEEYDVFALFFLELNTGLRKGELVALLWEDVDTENMTISVSKQASKVKGGIEITRPKTETSIRKLAVSPEVIEVLKAEHDRHPDNPCLFPSPKTGTYYHPDSIANLHKKILKKAGLEHIRLHDLRHTFATLALQNGVDIKTVSGMLGHYDAGFTLRTYTHATAAAQVEAAKTISSVITQAM